MTETQIETAVEKRMDALDERYLAGRMTDSEYRTAVRALDTWASTRPRTPERQDMPQ